MGRILTISSSKGGVGKTVLVTCLAPHLARLGYSVGVIDADPNSPFAAWYSNYKGPAFQCAAEAGDVAVVDLAQDWAEELDVVLVDTAGFGNLTAAAAMGASDWVLVPVMPDRGSTREAARTVAKATSLARAARRPIKASVVLSQWRHGGIAERAALEDLADFKVSDLLRTTLPDRTVLRQMGFDSSGSLSAALRAILDDLVAELVEIGAIEKANAGQERAV